MTGTCGDLVSVGLGGGVWDQQEERWVEKGGGGVQKTKGSAGEMGRREGSGGVHLGR